MPNRAQRRAKIAAFLAVMQDDYAAARPLAEESLRLGRQLADPDLTAVALNTLGLVLTESFEISRQIGDMFAEAYTLDYLGELAHFEGDPAGAYQQFVTAIRLCREVGETGTVLGVLAGIADLLVDDAVAEALAVDPAPPGSAN